MRGIGRHIGGLTKSPTRPAASRHGFTMSTKTRTMLNDIVTVFALFAVGLIALIGLLLTVALLAQAVLTLIHKCRERREQGMSEREVAYWQRPHAEVIVLPVSPPNGTTRLHDSASE